MTLHYFEALDAALATLDHAGRRRTLIRSEPLPDMQVRRGIQTLVNFSSNDYLGLALHPELRRRAAQFSERFGSGATASRLVCGTFEAHEAIEDRIAKLKGTEAALVLASGFQTNQGVLAALLDREICGSEPLVYCDKLNHASMHEGMMTAGLHQIRFRHNDLDHLESLLVRDAAKPGPRFIVTESVFSMDGDRANLPALCDLAERFGCLLYVDEAHATGVLGPRGAGLCADPAVKGRVDIVMGTFGKALGGFGSFVACSQRLRNWLINRCRAVIYSTAVPPSVLGAADAALGLIPFMDVERDRLRGYSEKLRTALINQGRETFGSSTQIVPVSIGEERDALAAAAHLQAHGLLAVAIRPPTVPPGTARLRIALSAAHSETQVESLIETLSTLPPSAVSQS